MAAFKEGTCLKFDLKKGTYVNFTQACRDCKKYYQYFEIDIDKYYDENGKSIVKTYELYEKFSFSCRRCGLLNILNFNELCNKETVLYLRRNKKENDRYLKEKEKKK